MTLFKDFTLSGIFRYKYGGDFIESIDTMILTGKRHPNITEFIEQLCEKYRQEMQLQCKVQSVKLNEIVNKLPKNYKTHQLCDRYAILMDVTRHVFHIHLTKQVVQKEKRNYANFDQKKFELRSRQKISKANTVISETTNVNSQFTST